jgi:poly-gamma-glutamate capsule biosynthesis protein CapA/YwtB (metallophosphatase superfamily)
MQLLCVGDIALVGNHVSDWRWPPPNSLTSNGEIRVLFNWELPIGDSLNPIPRISGPRLLSSLGSQKVIGRWAPSIAALATNHILDAGDEGLANTITLLQQEGFITIGAGMTQPEITKPLIWETDDGKLAILNWVFPETNPDLMCVPGPNYWPGIEGARSCIQELKREVDWVIVFAHWSDEDFPYPRLDDRIIAQQLADSGTDLLVSHHPHVVRGMEVIGSCKVFYSLGNYYFSDIIEESGDWIGKWAPRNRESLGILISFNRGFKPECNVLSFWQEKDKVINDQRNRAIRRLKQTSQPLSRVIENDYAEWYMAKRKRFDKIWVRWHFGIHKLGGRGLVRYVKAKIGSGFR